MQPRLYLLGQILGLRRISNGNIFPLAFMTMYQSCDAAKAMKRQSAQICVIWKNGLKCDRFVFHDSPSEKPFSPREVRPCISSESRRISLCFTVPLFPLHACLLLIKCRLPLGASNRGCRWLAASIMSRCHLALKEIIHPEAIVNHKVFFAVWGAPTFNRHLS